MNLFSQKFCFVLAGAALALAGCAQKPSRPDPSQTALGMSVGPASPTNQPPVIADFGKDDPFKGRGDTDPFGPGGRDPKALEAQTVYFDLDRSDIKNPEREKLKAAKAYLDQHPTYRLVLEGYCDWRGTSEYNLALGDRRAASVKKYLGTLGVPADKMDTLSKGSLEAAKNADDATMAKDRCVKLIVVDPSRAGPPAPPKA